MKYITAKIVGGGAIFTIRYRTSNERRCASRLIKKQGVVLCLG